MYHRSFLATLAQQPRGYPVCSSLQSSPVISRATRLMEKAFDYALDKWGPELSQTAWQTFFPLSMWSTLPQPLFYPLTTDYFFPWLCCCWSMPNQPTLLQSLPKRHLLPESLSLLHALEEETFRFYHVLECAPNKQMLLLLDNESQDVYETWVRFAPTAAIVPKQTILALRFKLQNEYYLAAIAPYALKESPENMTQKTALRITGREITKPPPHLRFERLYRLQYFAGLLQQLKVKPESLYH